MSEATAVVSHVPELEDYPLPLPVRDRLLEIADEADVLIFGEIHGTREIPYLIASLLPLLYDRSYRVLALELPPTLEGSLRSWMAGLGEIPSFYTSPNYDGRGNAEALSLIREACQNLQWALCCFDKTDSEAMPNWSDRDAIMARNVAQCWHSSPGEKIVAICGNMHSRLENVFPPENSMHKFWPAFAATLQAREPFLTVRSINTNFYSGTFYNMSVRNMGGSEAQTLKEIYLDEVGMTGHTADLHMPCSTAASFLAAPESLSEGVEL